MNGPISVATLWDGANFPDFVVARRWQTPGMRHSSLLELGKIGSRRHHPTRVSRPQASISERNFCDAINSTRSGLTLHGMRGEQSADASEFLHHGLARRAVG